MDVIVTADGSKTLTSAEFGESYGSKHGAMAEALHVFLQGSAVESRLAAGLPTRVLEVGFGTGLNFLVSATAACRYGTRLSYTAIERDPVDAATLRAVYQGSSLPPHLVAEFVGWAAAPLTAGVHTLNLIEGIVELHLLVGDALALTGPPESLAGAHAGYLAGAGCAAAAGYAVDADYAVDAVYLDAFSPKANPELWTPQFLARLAAVLAPGGTLVTFSVSGAVRRALAAAGLKVSKLPGPPGGKAQMLAASRPTPPSGPAS